MTSTATGERTMQPRIGDLVATYMPALKGLISFAQSAEDYGVPKKTLLLVVLRASQINGCSVCVDMHTKQGQRDGETAERLFAVGAWRDAPYFTDAERAALALTEAVTRIADQQDPVPDAVWAAAAEHYDDRQLIALVISIAGINAFNRLNVATRQVAGRVT